jgi:hypothetical protein
VRWKNNLALFAVPDAWLAPLPQFVQSWLANCVLCYIEYFLSGALWALWIYKCARAPRRGGAHAAVGARARTRVRSRAKMQRVARARARACTRCPARSTHPPPTR